VYAGKESHPEYFPYRLRITISVRILSQEDESEEENDLRGDDDFSLEDYMTDDDDTLDYRLNSSNASKDEETRDFVFSQASSFRESLIAQTFFQNCFGILQQFVLRIFVQFMLNLQ